MRGCGEQVSPHTTIIPPRLLRWGCSVFGARPLGVCRGAVHLCPLCGAAAAAERRNAFPGRLRRPQAAYAGACARLLWGAAVVCPCSGLPPRSSWPLPGSPGKRSRCFFPAPGGEHVSVLSPCGSRCAAKLAAGLRCWIPPPATSIRTRFFHLSRINVGFFCLKLLQHVPTFPPP